MAETPQAQKKLRETGFFLSCLQAEESKPTDLVVMLDVIQDELLRRGRQVGAETAKTTTGADAGA